MSTQESSVGLSCFGLKKYLISKYMSQVTYYTLEGLTRLKKELHEMKTIQRPAISQQIGEARDKGDLSENAEYDAAKEAQGLLEMKISKLDSDTS